MAPNFQNAFVAGFECVAAGSDVLDDINVFPVADGDTGRNLIVSLTPLRYLNKDRELTIHRLLQHARGNSGNIASRFLAGFLMADSAETLPHSAKNGNELARQAVYNPLPGTMLTVFDALVDFLETKRFEYAPEYGVHLVDHLETTVKKTPELLSRLKSAGVVDAGALGMYLFFEGFFNSLTGRPNDLEPFTEKFKGLLEVSSAFQESRVAGHCVDTVIRLDDAAGKMKQFSKYGDSVVVIPHKDYLKIHLHTENTEEAKKKLASLGEVLKWSDDDIGAQVKDFKQQPPSGAIHIMTDAAGSVTREDARRLGITLLDSYITAGDQSLPETRFSSSELYRLMRKGLKVSTSQASVFERHQYYQRVTHQYPKVLYLCVGSVYTGNYDVARKWKKKNDPDDRLTVIDTQAASGRLGVIVLAAARFAVKTGDPAAVIEFARRAVIKCEEYVFLDRLKYIAAGGRLSKPGAFLGDMFHARPIISPVAEGARKVGMVKNRKGQLEFAFERLKGFTQDSAPFIMLEYSDNFQWVNATVKTKIESRYPFAEILLQPLSLTSGVHMGPGTWGMAFLPETL